MIVAAGAAGARLLSRESLAGENELRLLIDLNAVPPSGIEGVEPTDFARDVAGVFQYGALGIGRIKMKLHKTCIVELFSSNELMMDAEQIHEIGSKFLQD